VSILLNWQAELSKCTCMYKPVAYRHTLPNLVMHPIALFLCSEVQCYFWMSLVWN